MEKLEYGKVYETEFQQGKRKGEMRSLYIGVSALKRFTHNLHLLYRNGNNQLIFGRFSEHNAYENCLAVILARTHKIVKPAEIEYAEWLLAKYFPEDRSD